MQTVEDLIKKLEILPDLVKVSADNAISEKSDDIIDLNKAQMLILGVDADGIQLGTYAPFTVEERQKRGLQTDYIDLRFTGDFQNSMKLEKKPDGFEIDATDGKWDGNEISPTLRQQWPAALGLTDDNEERAHLQITKRVGSDVDKFLSTNSPARINERVGA